jgi:hypothetical protein
MRRAALDNQAAEPPIYIENVSRMRENAFRALRVDGSQRIPTDPTEESWNEYARIPLAPPEGLVANGGPGGDAPVELVELALERVTKLKWGPAASQRDLPPLPPGAENQLCRVILPNFGDQDSPPGAYRPILVGGPPYDGHTWVVDGMNHFVEFPYGPPPAMDPDGLALFFYRYTGPTGGISPWHYSGGILCPNPEYPGAGSSGDWAAPLPAQSTEGPGRRLMITRDGSVRGGVVDGGQWDAPNRGENSTAFGLNNTAAGDNSTASGGSGNVAGGVYSAVVGGMDNSATEPYANVAGGANNLSDGAFATISGGQSNLAIGYNSAIGGGIGNYAGDQLAFIGGGYLNTAGHSAVASGGQNNSATGQYSAIGGGANNQALGAGSVVPGGMGNTAAGAASYSAGTNARANHDGAFVWGDGAGLTESIGDNSWAASASGGAIFWTDSTRIVGASLAPSASSWASVCDRRAKENISPLDPADILSRVGELPLYEYNYRGMGAGAKYRGPMAQDWHRLFPSEKDRTRIETLDFDGVALGAIQGLLARVEDLAARVKHLEGCHSGSPSWVGSGVGTSVGSPVGE